MVVQFVNENHSALFQGLNPITRESKIFLVPLDSSAKSNTTRFPVSVQNELFQFV